MFDLILIRALLKFDDNLGEWRLNMIFQGWLEPRPTLMHSLVQEIWLRLEEGLVEEDARDV